MNFELKTLDLKAAAGFNTDAVVVLLPNSFKPGRDAISQLVTKARANADLDDSVGKLLSIWHAEGVKAPRLILVSTGEGSARSVRTATAAAVAALKSVNPKSIAVCMPDGTQQRVHALVQAVCDASYVFTTTKPSAIASLLKRVTVGLPTPEKVKTVKVAFTTATALAQGVALAKEWGNRPANHATPTMLARAAQSLAKKLRIKCQVLGPKEVEKLGMGSFAAVAQGSSEPLRFIVLQYAGAAKTVAPTVIIGKGITFDTGGISLKAGPGMDEMKFDMCG
ncbi:MAG: M17 family peptidase N-terminal domain-containing protein, partial [Betaproteobacteria bacterium]